MQSEQKGQWETRQRVAGARAEGASSATRRLEVSEQKRHDLT